MNLLAWFRRPPLAATIDLADPRIARNPYPHYEALRKAGPVQYLAKHDFWIVLGHAEVKAAFDQPRIFSNIAYNDVDAVLLAADPPHHTPIRRAVSRLFSGDALARLTRFAEAQADRLLKDELDIVGDYAVPYTRAVAARLIGFDDDALAAVANGLAEAERRGASFAELVRFLDNVAERSAAYRTFREPASGGFGDGEARSLVRLLWLAATTTTERAIVNCALRLAEDDGLRARLAGSEALLDPFTEEVLRLHPPEHLIRRVTTAPVKLGDVNLPAGASVQLCLPAANRDPGLFPEATELRLDRPAKQHLAFGFGFHFCPGAALARLLVPVAVGRLAARPRLRPLEPLESIDYAASLSSSVPRRLPIGL